MIDKLKQLNELRRQSQQMQKDLDSEVLEVEHKGVTVVVTAGMKVNSINTNGRSDDDVTSAVNKALQEAQKIAAKKMRSQLGAMGLDLPGF
ncbi:YbaB/EbfC family nucleoid-associated protein [candidate division WWE3 bacterium]|nr:YbaB/EbfC family nucleoid-associated protein [candidate division WWE3 bacterium]